MKPPENDTTMPNLCRSTRISQPPERSSLLSSLQSVAIPRSYKQAVVHKCWNAAMKEELKALDENQTWDIVSCPPDIIPIGCKWVHTVKLKADGSLDGYKARLVALGNNQEYRLDYDETFAPVAKMTTFSNFDSYCNDQVMAPSSNGCQERVSSWQS